MAEYIDKDKIPWAKVDNPKGIFWERVVFESAINNMTLADVVERSKIDKAIDEIIEKSFISDIYNDRTDDEIIKLDDVLEILKRSIGE